MDKIYCKGPIFPAAALIAEVLPISILEPFIAVAGPGLCVVWCGREDVRGEVDSIELKGFKHINHNKPLPQ